MIGNWIPPACSTRQVRKVLEGTELRARSALGNVGHSTSGREERPVALGARPALIPIKPIAETVASINASVFCTAVWPLRRTRNSSDSAEFAL